MTPCTVQWFRVTTEYRASYAGLNLIPTWKTFVFALALVHFICDLSLRLRTKCLLTSLNCTTSSLDRPCPITGNCVMIMFATSWSCYNHRIYRGIKIYFLVIDDSPTICVGGIHEFELEVHSGGQRPRLWRSMTARVIFILNTELGKSILSLFATTSKALEFPAIWALMIASVTRMVWYYFLSTQPLVNSHIAILSRTFQMGRTEVYSECPEYNFLHWRARTTAYSACWASEWQG